MTPGRHLGYCSDPGTVCGVPETAGPGTVNINGSIVPVACQPVRGVAYVDRIHDSSVRGCQPDVCLTASARISIISPNSSDVVTRGGQR